MVWLSRPQSGIPDQIFCVPVTAPPKFVRKTRHLFCIWFSRPKKLSGKPDQLFMSGFPDIVWLTRLICLVWFSRQLSGIPDLCCIPELLAFFWSSRLFCSLWYSRQVSGIPDFFLENQTEFESKLSVLFPGFPD